VSHYCRTHHSVSRFSCIPSDPAAQFYVDSRPAPGSWEHIHGRTAPFYKRRLTNATVRRYRKTVFDADSNLDNVVRTHGRSLLSTCVWHDYSLLYIKELLTAFEGTMYILLMSIQLLLQYYYYTWTTWYFNYGGQRVVMATLPNLTCVCLVR
jgi:hypothetical protein